MRLLLQISALLICISAQEHRAKRGAEFVPYRTGKKVASQVSTALDRLLFFSGYDKQIRPGVRILKKMRMRAKRVSEFRKNSAKLRKTP